MLNQTVQKKLSKIGQRFFYSTKHATTEKRDLLLIQSTRPRNSETRKTDNPLINVQLRYAPHKRNGARTFGGHRAENFAHRLPQLDFRRQYAAGKKIPLERDVTFNSDGVVVSDLNTVPDITRVS